MVGPMARPLFREMAAEDGEPTLGPEDLGVRVGTDITPNGAGEVLTESGGMSVAPDDPFNLHRIHRPPSLGGTGTKPVWEISVHVISSPLTYRPDPRRPDKHGLVEPDAKVSLASYIAALEATVSDWVLAGA